MTRRVSLVAAGVTALALAAGLRSYRRPTHRRQRSVSIKRAIPSPPGSSR